MCVCNVMLRLIRVGAYYADERDPAGVAKMKSKSAGYGASIFFCLMHRSVANDVGGVCCM